MKTLIAIAFAAFSVFAAYSAPHRGPSPRPAPRPAPVMHRAPIARPMPARPAPHHSHSSWGHGGRNFWPGFVGGVVGSTLVGRPAPVIVSPRPVFAPPPPPIVLVNQVWTEPAYELRPIYDVYGNIVEYQWVMTRAGY